MSVLLLPTRRNSRDFTWDELVFRTPGSQSELAFRIAFEVHGPQWGEPLRKGQWRAHPERDRRGRPYIQHPIGVARLALAAWADPETGLAEQMTAWGFTVDTMMAVLLLHDVIEHLDAKKTPSKRMTPEQARHMLLARGVAPEVLLAVDGLTYIPSAPKMSLSARLEEQAATIKSNPVALLLKPFDLAHNTLPTRLYPYLSAKDTVHSIWKYVNLCILAHILPATMPQGFKALSGDVKGLDGLEDLPLTKEQLFRLENWHLYEPFVPPKEDVVLCENLEALPRKSWPRGGMEREFSLLLT